MQHPNHECVETIPNMVTLPDGSLRSVPIVIEHCKFNNLRTRPMTHKRRKRTRFEATKPERCVCGRLRKHCTVKKVRDGRCGCGAMASDC